MRTQCEQNHVGDGLDAGVTPFQAPAAYQHLSRRLRVNSPESKAYEADNTRAERNFPYGRHGLWVLQIREGFWKPVMSPMPVTLLRMKSTVSSISPKLLRATNSSSPAQRADL
jgi:hypothetical protein